MSNYISRFYANQSILRGIKSVADIEKWEVLQSKVYDRLLSQYLKPHKNSKVVELACGPGIFLRYLKRQGFDNAVGIELADTYVELCLTQELKVIEADVFEWLKVQPDSSIDVIVAIDFIEHLDKQTFINLLDLISSVLSPDGCFIARGPCGDSPFVGLNFYNDITHETVFTNVALKTLMSMCNLEIITTIDEYPARLTGKKRLLLLPLIILARFITSSMIRLSTGYCIDNLSPDMWIISKHIKQNK